MSGAEDPRHTEGEYEVPYGATPMRFSPPEGMSIAVCEPPVRESLADLKHAVDEALQHPAGSPPLRQLAGPGDKACVVFTDVTRPCPDDVLVPALLRELEEAGVRDEDVTLLCGTGLHRPSTRAEKAAKLGAGVGSRYRVVDNAAGDATVMVELGTTSGGAPVSLHRDAAGADILIATGLVEPHQYAGYSGGYKTAVVGAGGEPFIAHTHGPAYVEDPDTRLGQVEGNPFQAAVSEAGAMAGLRFVANVVLDGDRLPLQVAAGEPGEVFAGLVRFARRAFEVAIPRQYDVAIGGVGHPKDANLYQASRAASHLHFGAAPVVRRGGFYIVPARCYEGAGDGMGEKRFFAAMSGAPDVPSIIERARREGYAPGAQRAFVLAKVLEHNKVVIVGSKHPDVVAACKLHAADTVEEALALASQALGADLEVLLVPHALQCLPVVRQ